MRRHPVILTLCLLLFIGMVLFAVIYGLSALQGEGGSFSLRGKVGVVRIEGMIGDTAEIIGTERFGEEGVRSPSIGSVRRA